MDSRKRCEYCYTSTESSIHSRHCFMTGEHCSKQMSIQRERKKLYGENDITAFVIMNFSDMSDVVYKWRLKTFIESLSKYLYFDRDHKRLYCSSAENDDKMADKDRVRDIHVVRSDSDPSSNYVICSRICQQMQIADIVIIDVSSQNANVFYEFGMAVALGKLILPICYSESFYKMVIPKKIKDVYWDLKERDNIEHHIGFFPWRKDLFEYYGIRYRPDEPATQYLKYEDAINTDYGFSDIKYNRFPYHESLPGAKEKIGRTIYERLSAEYNNRHKEDNTLVVYTMDAFLNGEQAGRCIVNFYCNITARMRQEKCFCGERVGVLVQENVIPENEKDAKGQLDIFYSVGEIIQIGLNQATYLAAEEKIKSYDKSIDFTMSEKESDKKSEEKQQTDSQRAEIENFVKSHIKNRGIRIYPNNPVFVERMKNLWHDNLLKEAKQEKGQTYECCNLDSFCLYHVMLRTLRYTNEIVVDISNNCLQSLFWLGAAHGSDIYAITVIHEKTDKEKTDREMTDTMELFDTYRSEKEKRYIFDVAGLWMAILRKNDTEGFYKQLASAQSGIERHSKLMLPDSGYYNRQMRDLLFSSDTISDEKLKSLYEQKKKEEKDTLESYYRDRFWAPMLKYNELSIYSSQINETDEDNEPKLYMNKWDFDAISVLSHYLSKRKVIGEYSLISLPADKKHEKAKNINFISVGSSVKPLETDLPDYIYSKFHADPFETNIEDGINVIHKWTRHSTQNTCNGGLKFKGFERVDGNGTGIFTQHPQAKTCITCREIQTNGACSTEARLIYSLEEANNSSCHIRNGKMHYELAQLILWREESEDVHMRCYFRVAINGCSGPATFALSTLFVDKEQKEICFPDNEDINKMNNLLYDLQSTVRERFKEVFLERLRNELNGMNFEFYDENEKMKSNPDETQKERYINLVQYAVDSYLRTVLYRYFFPFLSENDIERIYNGMYIFVNSMKAARQSPFAIDFHSGRERKFPSVVSNEIVNNIVKLIPEILLFTLKSFRGLEAFYVVKVRHQPDEGASTKEDTRSVQKIEMLKKPVVNCFFIKPHS